MSSSPVPSQPPEFEYDPVFLNSRREALVIFCIWAVGLVWAVPFCYFNGHLDYLGEFDPNTFKTIWGIPSWLFWGIAVPWLVADVLTTWFCFFYMVDDDLGTAHEGADLEEEIAELHAAHLADRAAGQHGKGAGE